MNDQDEDVALPEGWAAATMGDVVTPSREKIHPSEVPDSQYLGLEHVEANTQRIIGEGRASDVRSTKSAFRAGDVLYGKLRPYLNKVAQPSFDGICSTDFLVFGRSPALDSHFLAHFLSQPSFVEFAHHASNGVELPRVAWKALATFPLALPPLMEQRRIAEQLNDVELRRASVANHLRAARTALDRLRGAVLAAACAGRLTHDWRAERDLIDGDDLPSGWSRDPVEALAADEPRSIQSGPFGSNLKHSEFQPAGKLVIGIDNVLDGKFSMGSEHRIGDSKFAELRRYEARPLDVLITVMATVGRVCVVPASIEQAIITKHVYRITVDQQRVVPHFLMLALRGHPQVRAQIQYQTRGQTRPGINGGIVKALIIPVPPLDEQEEIVRRTDALLVAADRLAAHLDQVRNVLDRVSPATLGKAFRGELVPTEAALAEAECRDYESGDELLAVLDTRAVPTTKRRRERMASTGGTERS